MKTNRTLAFAAIGMVLTAVPLHTQGSTANSLLGTARLVKGAGSARSMIAGTVLDPQSKPMINAPVRLRNLQTGRLDQTAVTNAAGEFRLVAIPDVPYVVELADVDGRIVSISDVIVAHVGEVAATTLTAEDRVPGFARIFGSTAGSIIAAMTGLGITAAGGGQPLSPEK
jgi:hypothetical protein